MRKLLVADPSGELSRILTRELQEKCLIRCCETGSETLELLESFCPDTLVLDLNLPGMDGLTLLQTARDQGCAASVLAVTTLANSYIRQSLQDLAVSYAMMKPCNPRALALRVEDLLRSPEESAAPDPYVRITAALLSLGIRSNRDGYAYLVPAILYRARHPRSAITKEIYPAVAKVCGGNALQVERDIRLAIESGWKTGDREIWNRIFPGLRKRPSNGLFVHRMAELLRLEETGAGRD